MKKLTILFAALFCFSVFATGSHAASEGEIKTILKKSIAESMKGRGMDVNVEIEVLKKMDNPSGYYFMKLTFFDKKNPGAVAGEQFVFSDGNFVVQDFLNAKDMSSVGKDLNFELSYKDIDVSNLTPVIGKRGAKNIIIEVSDFQCPFCIKANEYLHEKFKNNKDVVVYLMHLPLRSMHPKADILAKIFEAGSLMGKNFSTELYDPSNHEGISDVQLIEKYAAKSGDPKKFKDLVASEQVLNIVTKAEAQAKALGVRSTPTIFINGKTIAGFDIPLMEKAIADFK